MAHAQPRRQSSNIWDNFTRSDDKLKATCNICQAVLACRNYGTSSLIYHMKHKHGKDQQVDKPSPSTSAKRQKVLPFRLKPKVTQEELYAELVTYDNVPPRVCAKSSFIRTGMKLRGFKEVTSATTVAAKVKAFDTVVRHQLKEKLAGLIEEGQRMSLTTDEYTATNNKRYLTITLHYTAEDYDNLGMVRVFGSQTSKTLKDLIEKKLHEFGINWNHIVACTTDGASVMVRMGNLMLPLHGVCLSHAIHLAVSHVLYQKPTSLEVLRDDVTATGSLTEEGVNAEENSDDGDVELDECVDVVNPQEGNEEEVLQFKEEIETAVKKVRKMVKKIRRSPVKSDFLRAKCVEAGETITTLILDCRTRWNSLADMLERYIKLHATVARVLEEYDYPTRLQLTSSELDIIKHVSGALQLVKVAASYLSDRKVNLMTADTIISETISALNSKNTCFPMQLAEHLSVRYEQRKMTNALQLMRYLDGRQTQEESSTLTLSIQRFATMLSTRLFGVSVLEVEPPSQRNDNTGGDSSDTDDVTIVESENTQEADIDALSFAEMLNKKLNETYCESAQSASSASASQTPCFEEFKLFVKTGEKTEKLKKLEAALYTIQASSVESERAFSAAGLFLTKLRCRMSDATFDRYCFLKAYFKKRKAMQ